MPKRALVLIDVQNDYFPGGKWPLVGIESAAGNAAKLLSAARAAGDLVVHVRHEFASAEASLEVPMDADRALLTEFETQVQAEMDRLAVLVEEMATSRCKQAVDPATTSHVLSHSS